MKASEISIGDCYQLGMVDESKGWNDQPPLAYVYDEPRDGLIPVVLHGGEVRLLDPSTDRMEYRGNVNAADLAKIMNS
jgi:hypothetical protein